MNADLFSLKDFVRFTGLLHFCQIPAMFFAPKMLAWETDLARLTPINRRIFQVVAGAIVLTVLGLGCVVAAVPGEIVDGGRLGIALLCFLSILWAYRALTQIFLYARIWPGGWRGRLSHYGLTALFTFLSGSYLTIFLLCVWGGGSPE